MNVTLILEQIRRQKSEERDGRKVAVTRMSVYRKFIIIKY